MEIQKQDINKKNFIFAKEIARLCESDEDKKDIIDLLKGHFYPTDDGHIYLSIRSIHYLIGRKSWMMYQEDENRAIEFMKLPILEQLRIFRAERGSEEKILKKVRREVYPWIEKFLKLKIQIPSPFDQNWIISDKRSLKNITNYALMIQRIKRLDLSEIDKGMITLNYYLMLLEGPFEDKIDFIFALIILVDGKIFIPSRVSGKPPKVINQISGILEDHFTLGWKKDGLKHYNMPYLSKCLDNNLRNQIAHSKYEINDSGKIFLEDGTELRDLYIGVSELIQVIDSLAIIFHEPIFKENMPGIEEILEKIKNLVDNGKNPFPIY